MPKSWIKLNARKYINASFGKSFIPGNYHINNMPLSSDPVVQEVVTYVDSDLKNDQHVPIAVKVNLYRTAYKQRLCISMDVNSSLHSALIRSTTEYNNAPSDMYLSRRASGTPTEIHY